MIHTISLAAIIATEFGLASASIINVDCSGQMSSLSYFFNSLEVLIDIMHIDMDASVGDLGVALVQVIIVLPSWVIRCIRTQHRYSLWREIISLDSHPNTVLDRNPQLLQISQLVPH
ncbi:hypothetical protein BDR05DRAFT_970242 [Suillus weaverae]|nr:hypothetical protein BDR05DRAFT_970242 [Suillus weaverae]